jgi:hypothetical protein
METKTTIEIMNLNKSYSLEDEREKQTIIKNNPKWVKVDDIQKCMIEILKETNVKDVYQFVRLIQFELSQSNGDDTNAKNN